MADAHQHSPRINERLFNYWEEQKRGRAFPSESDIDPDDLGDVWDYCFLATVHGPREFKYSYLGHALIDAYGDDVTNEQISSQLIEAHHPPMIKKFEEVVAAKAPIIDDSEFTNRRGQQIRYRSCLLPLGAAPGDVKYILGGMKWKAY